MDRRLIHILLCSPRGNTGGIARWTDHVINYYNSLANPEVQLNWCYAPKSKRNILAGTNLIIRVFFGIVNNLPFIKRLRTEIKVNNYDAVHFCSSASVSLFRDILTLKMCHRKGLKTIVHYRFGRIPELFEKKNWEWNLLTKAVRLANQVVVIDRASFETLHNAGFKHVVYLPNPAAPAVGAFFGTHCEVIPRLSRVLLFVGHVVRTKGVYELVEACRGISEIRLKIVGPLLPGIREDLLGLASKENGDVSWIEIIGDLPYKEVLEEMMKCAVFVLPSYTEGFPNVILESMACGCPIVATSVGAIPEMLDDGAGIVIEPRNVNQLREAVCKVLKNPEYATRMGAKAAQRVHEKYSMPAVWSQLTDIWKGML